MLQEHDAFRCDLNPLTAFRAGNDVVHSDHVVAGILKTDSILFVRPRRERWLFGSDYPSDLKFGRLAALRTLQGLGFRLRLFREEIAFLHLFSFAGNSGPRHPHRIQNLLEFFGRKNLFFQRDLPDRLA